MNAVTGPRRAVRPRTALVVEDEPTLRATLAAVLEDEGFEVMTASTLARARYVLLESRHPVGVVVLDLKMPDGDGEALVGELQQAPDKIVPLVVLSSFPRRAQPLAELYGVPYVTKPFDMNQLIATIVVAYDNDIRPERRLS